MSRYYKPDRNPNWNYGGERFRLSRSKIGLFLECARCFYIDNKLGTARPPGYPFSLNSAVDTLLKKEFDIHRANRTQHPLMKKYGVDAVPLDDDRMDEWRDSLKRGICHRHGTGFMVCGGVDDVWVNPKGELIIVDYKATSKGETITELDEEWHEGYKKQMEVYQWLFRRNDFKVSDTGYFVYANADKERDMFNHVLEFEVTLVPYTGNDSWVEGTLKEIRRALDGDLPPASLECDYCHYREAVGKKLLALAPAGNSPKAQATLGI